MLCYENRLNLALGNFINLFISVGNLVYYAVVRFIKIDVGESNETLVNSVFTETEYIFNES